MRALLFRCDTPKLIAEKLSNNAQLGPKPPTQSRGDGLPVGEAREFFAGNRTVAPILRAVVDVGLDYLRLGQPLTSLSGGECQRIKLASHLHKQGAIYVLDEPTTGLHMSDVTRLLDVLDRLVDERAGSVVVIEHDLDVIAHADWVIDLGPEGGSAGGRIMFEGTPTNLLTHPSSHTAEHLRRATT